MKLIGIVLLVSISLFGCSKDSQPESGTQATGLPSAPQGLQAVASGQEISVSWDAVNNADGYTLFWSTSANVDGNSTSITGVSSPYLHSGLDTDTTYYYRVRAVNAQGKSELSAAASATTRSLPPEPVSKPGVPGGVAAIPGDGLNYIRWNTVSGADFYNIYWSTTDDPSLKKITNVQSPYTHVNLVNTTTYNYSISAENVAGESDLSVQVIATPMVFDGIDPPSGVSALEGDQQITLTWQPVANAVTYNVYWSDHAGSQSPAAVSDGDLHQVFYNASSPFVHTGLTNNTNNFYYITAVNANGLESVASTEVMATPSAVAALELEAVPLSTQVRLLWNAQAGHTYNVYYSSQSGFVAQNYADYPDGNRIDNVLPPFTINNLTNGTAYYFVLEELSTTSVLSTEVGARPYRLFFGGINASSVGPDGNVYLGGYFNKVGAAVGGGIPVTLSTNKPQRVDYPMVSGEVQAVESDGKGGWYIGGLFSYVDKLPRGNLAHILADGSLDLNWMPTVSGPVDIMSFDGSTLFIGGSFSQVNNQKRANLAALDLAGNLTNWIVDTDFRVYSIAAANNTVYIGGAFRTVNGQAVDNNLAAVAYDGSLLDWPTAASLYNIGYINSIAANDTTVVFGGGGGVAVFPSDGKSVVITPTNGGVDKVALSSSKVYVGGSFTDFKSSGYDRLAAMDLAGNVLDWGPMPFAAVEDIEVDNDAVYVPGIFPDLKGYQAGLAKFDSNGTFIDWYPGLTGKIAVSGDIAYRGGDFEPDKGVARKYLAAVDSNGSLSEWHPQAINWVNALLYYENSIYVGGVNHVTAYGADSRRRPWELTVEGGSRRVNALAAEGNTIYVGGSFVILGGIWREGMAAIGLDGIIGNWNPASSGEVYSLAVDNGVVYAGGNFTTMDGQTRNGLAAIGADGTVTSWMSGVATDGNVYALAVVGDSVYVGGQFGALGGIRNFAIIGKNGVTSLLSPTVNGTVDSLLPFNGDIYLGGSFTFVAGQKRYRAAAIDGSNQLLNWNPIVDDWLGPEAVKTISPTNGHIVLGGDFNAIGNQSAGGFAVIAADGSPL